MINIRPIVNRAIQPINPDVIASIKVSAGYTTRPNGQRVPSYNTISTRVQVQALTWKDLQQVDGLNISGQARGMYMDDSLNGVVRASASGGDLVTFPDNADTLAGTWLVVHVLEQWSPWVKVAIVQQNGPGS